MSEYASVLMKDTISEKMIQVKVHNNSIDERKLIFKIRDTIRELNNMFKNINVEELVPCNCSSDCSSDCDYQI